MNYLVGLIIPNMFVVGSLTISNNPKSPARIVEEAAVVEAIPSIEPIANPAVVVACITRLLPVVEAA